MMTQAIVFQTPGLIDPRSFTTFGLNSKPNTQTPIGYFGTGLKYAVAVLCRNNPNRSTTPSILLYIGRDEYSFSSDLDTFRDKEFHFIRMRRKKWSLTRATTQNMPFTTELGKNWKMWQAFRELESNTKDEQGRTLLINIDDLNNDDNRPIGLITPDTTTIVVKNDEFVQAYLDKDEIFLPGGLNVRESSDRLQILNRPSKYLFYRGLRVHELQKPSLYTYNFLSQMELTEDRTLKYEFMARMNLADYISQSEDPQLIEQVVTCPDNNWEANLDFDYVSKAPSDEYLAIVHKRQGAVGKSAFKYYGSWAPTNLLARQSTWEIHPRPWSFEADGIYDADNKLILTAGHQASNKIQLFTDVVDFINNAQGDS